MPSIMVWFIELLVSVALEAIAYLIAPKPKANVQGVQDLQAPTAEAGRAIPVVFGSLTVKGSNVLFYTDVETNTYKTDAGGGGK